MKEPMMHGMKSYDCHVFMQKLIQITFRKILSEHVWSALTEVSLLFQILCSTTLDVNKVQELKGNVATILCNLEKIFSPAFFDLMEHLIVHMLYEARVGGPVQYRWMYPFERGFLEIGLFTFHYFEQQILCKWNRPRRNDNLTMNANHIQRPIFNHPSRASGTSKKRWLNSSERRHPGISPEIKSRHSGVMKVPRPGLKEPSQEI
ncbi:UNVERIFIED_CONTAM: hypothetical protein Slati_3489300 [Sesamum latifolium]|uniref:DUF4218 domain-containing protein n=1 Tax=Sesamum latifolium TaxID=2727402 RepID=A0AAW2UGZ9_9LAMI